MRPLDWDEANCGNGCRPIPGSTCCPTCDPPENWYDLIGCKEHELDLFFGGAASDRIAVRICATCPVRPYCLEKGWDEDHGVWGGTTEGERRHLHSILRLDSVSRRQKRRAIREYASRPLQPEQPRRKK